MIVGSTITFEPLYPTFIGELRAPLNLCIQRSDKTPPPWLEPSFSILTASLALRISLMNLLCPYYLQTARKCSYLDLEHRFHLELAAET